MLSVKSVASISYSVIMQEMFLLSKQKQLLILISESICQSSQIYFIAKFCLIQYEISSTTDVVYNFSLPHFLHACKEISFFRCNIVILCALLNEFTNFF